MVMFQWRHFVARSFSGRFAYSQKLTRSYENSALNGAGGASSVTCMPGWKLTTPADIGHGRPVSFD